MYLRSSSSEYINQSCIRDHSQAQGEDNGEDPDRDQAGYIRLDRVQDSNCGCREGRCEHEADEGCQTRQTDLRIGHCIRGVFVGLWPLL